VSRFVLDASVALAWFVDKPQAPYALEIRRRLIAGARAVVPSLWHLEMANGFALAERRRAFTPTETHEYLAELESLLGTCIDTEVDVPSLRELVGSAIALRLSAYDAVYLSIAQRLALPLVTLDRDLQIAADTAGVPVIS